MLCRRHLLDTKQPLHSLMSSLELWLPAQGLHKFESVAIASWEREALVTPAPSWKTADSKWWRQETWLSSVMWPLIGWPLTTSHLCSRRKLRLNSVAQTQKKTWAEGWELSGWRKLEQEQGSYERRQRGVEWLKCVMYNTHNPAEK